MGVDGAGFDFSLVGRVLAMGLAAAGMALSLLGTVTGADYSGAVCLLLGLAVVVLASSGMGGRGE